METTICQIHHKPTGSFKQRGYNNHFSKRGKLWPLSELKKHIKLFKPFQKTLLEGISTEYGKDYKVEDCEVIEYAIVEIRRIPLTEMIEELS